MQLMPTCRTWLATEIADRFRAKFAGGSIVLLSGTPSRTFPNALVEVSMDAFTFAATDAGELTATDTVSVAALGSGDIGWGQLRSADGTPLAVLSVDTEPGADVLLEKRFVERQAAVTFTGMTLRIPVPAGSLG